MSPRKHKSVIEYRSYYLPADFPVLLLTGDMWRISDVLHDSLHFHNCLEIGICQSDSGTLHFYNGDIVPYTSGDITCIPRYIPHTTCSAPSTASKWTYLFFDPRQLFLDVIPGISKTDFEPMVQSDVSNYLFHGNDTPKIQFLVQVIIEELSCEDPNHMLIKSYLYALFTELTRKLGPTSVPISSLQDSSGKIPASQETNTLIIAPALTYIEDNYMNKFPIERLAEICHLSPTHFRRIFQSTMQTSPLSYLNNIRIINACGLLRNTSQTILSIAEATGFSTLSNFNRQFSQMMQMSPRAYRKLVYQDPAYADKPIIIEYNGWTEPEKE